MKDSSGALSVASSQLPITRPFWVGMKIINDRQYRAAGDMLRNLAALKKRISGVLDPFVNTANKAHKSATAERRGHLDVVDEGFKTIKAAMLSYEDEARAAAPDSDAPVSGALVPKLDGISRTSIWKADIVDREALLGFVVENFNEWGHLIKFDGRSLDKLAAAHRQGVSRTIPGVEARESIGLSALPSGDLV